MQTFTVIGRSLTPPTLPLMALIDSGADGSSIPLPYLRQVQARKERSLWMRTVTGKLGCVPFWGLLRRTKLTVRCNPPNVVRTWQAFRG